MRKHSCTALVSLVVLVAGSARAQFSGAWSNYFATETMAAECYSASVERCHAAGVTPDSPSWWDYIVGKNHAKLVEVKNNIQACRPYYCITSNVDNQITQGIAGIVWTNDASFLMQCGLSTNFFDDTPYFKTQYPATTNGWRDVQKALLAMSDTWLTNQWRRSSIILYQQWRNLVNTGGVTWADAKAHAEDEWGPHSTISFPTGPGSVAWRVSFGYSLNGLYWGWAYSFHNRSGYLSVNSNIWHSADVYCKGEVPSTNTTGVAFDSQSANVSNGWYLAESVSARSDATYTNAVIGGLDSSTTDPGIPSWCDEPTDSTGTALGWKVLRTNQVTIMHWAVTNGFKYR